MLSETFTQQKIHLNAFAAGAPTRILLAEFTLTPSRL